jgi:hypothetical protein
VLEVNWRATHIDTGSGLLIMPNSARLGVLHEFQSATGHPLPRRQHRVLGRRPGRG